MKLFKNKCLSFQTLVLSCLLLIVSSAFASPEQISSKAKPTDFKITMKFGNNAAKNSKKIGVLSVNTAVEIMKACSTSSTGCTLELNTQNAGGALPNPLQIRVLESVNGQLIPQNHVCMITVRLTANHNMKVSFNEGSTHCSVVGKSVWPRNQLEARLELAVFP